MSYQQRTDPDATFELGPLRIYWDHGKRIVIDELGAKRTQQMLAPAYVLPGGARIPEREAAFQAAERICLAVRLRPCRILRDQ